MWAPVVALVGVEPHLAVAERAERLAVGIELVADQHHVVPSRRVADPGCSRLRRHPLGDRAEIGCKPPLVVLAEALAAEQQHGVLVPGVLDLAQRFRIQRAAKIDAADFRPDHGMQPDNRNRPDPISRDCHVSPPSPTIAPCNISGRPARQTPSLPSCARAQALRLTTVVPAKRAKWVKGGGPPADPRDFLGPQHLR
ncbi:MAG: hypothetical protein QOD29_4879 [Alphaproteobacteria bacterium]|nr:hypothetical protein [Alphaproteobacteria bacterium]